MTEPCPSCGLDSDCKCDPPIVTAAGEHWRCEGCGIGILTGERVYLYADEDETVVTHLECSGRVSA